MRWLPINLQKKLNLNMQTISNFHSRFSIALVMLCLLSACSSSGKQKQKFYAPVDISNAPNASDAVPKSEPRSKYGNPKSYVVFGKRYYVMDDAKGFSEQGIASWYGKKFHGKRTSSGETYDMHAMTAAHKTLPLPSYVEVSNLENKKKVLVKVNDRGPFHENRIIDLSYAAATKLGIVAKGTGLVSIKAIDAKTDGSPSKVQAEAENEGKNFYIQVGAFSDIDNAKYLQKKLRNISRSSVKISQKKDQKMLYRVRIGPLNSIRTADNIIEALIKIDQRDHHIVVE